MKITLACPECGAEFDATATVSHDSGHWRTANGDGWPESTDVNWLDLPDACPAPNWCCYVWTDTDMQAFDVRAVEHWQGGADDYNGPTEPEDKYDR